MSMKKLFSLSLVFVLLVSFSACSIKTVPNMGPEVRGYYDGSIVPEDAIDVTIDTTMGAIDLRLFPSEAPKAVENFTTLAKDGYYDGSSFHRVIQDFMIQSGKPESGDGNSMWGEGFETEFNGRLYHFYGAISMANTGEENSNGSQFFIVDATTVDSEQLSMTDGWPQDALDIYSEVGGSIHLDGQHPVFGYVTEGMDVVDAIASVETDENDTPLEEVLINSVTVHSESAA